MVPGPKVVPVMTRPKAQYECLMSLCAPVLSNQINWQIGKPRENEIFG